MKPGAKNDLQHGLNHALGLGGGGASSFQGFTPKEGQTPHDTHELADGADVCPRCHLKTNWPGIVDRCRGAKKSRRMGIHIAEVPAVFAMLWADFKEWWESKDFGQDTAPTADEWLHQLMEFRIEHRKALEE